MREPSRWLDIIINKLSPEDIAWIHANESPKANKLAMILYFHGWECCK